MMPSVHMAFYHISEQHKVQPISYLLILCSDQTLDIWQYRTSHYADEYIGGLQYCV